jgi:sugar phosphate isomerase/epimerase
MNRRKFLKDSTLAATALMVVPGCMPSTTGKMKYEIGVQLYTVRDAMMSDPLGTLEKVAKIGYKKIETASYDAGRAYGYTAKEFKSVLDDLGLKLISGHVSQSFFENSFEEVVGFCVEAGQEYIVFPWLPAEERATIDQYKGHAASLIQRTIYVQNH